MKKIRILALILALLMLPLSMLVACSKDDEDIDSGETEDDGTGSGQSRPTTSTTTTYDDGTKSGYLCYFNFDAAPTGRFQGVTPYSFFSNYNNGEFVFGRRDIGGKKGGYLGIVKPASKENPYYDLAVMNLIGFSFTHVVSFDIYLGGGVVKDGIQFVGRKGAGIFNNFLNFAVDGSVYAASKHKIYTADPAGEWVNFAVAINDSAREFDVYVNGSKVIMGVPYPTENYPAWEDQKIDRYRITVAGSNNEASEMRIDNFGVSGGLTPQNATGEDNIIYTDTYTIVGNLLTLDANIDAAKQTVLDIYSQNDYLLDRTKNDPYSSGILMSSSLSLSKINFVGDIGVATELQYDYGVETGKYKFGGIIGGKTFYSDPELGKSYEFRSTIIKEGADVGKLIVVNEEGREGTYSLAGDEDFIKITIIIDNVTTYAVYTDGVFKTVPNSSFNPDDAKAVTYNEGAFHGKTYSYNVGSKNDTENDYVSIVFSPDEINKKISFSMKVNDTVDISISDVAYEYDFGILTFTHNSEIYYLAYNAKNDDFTLVTPEAKSYLLSLPAEEKITVGADDIIAIHYQNFASGTSTLALQVDSKVAMAKPWEKILVKAYVPESLVKKKFTVRLVCGTNDYYSVDLQFSKSGIYEKAVPFNEFAVTGAPEIANLSKIELRMPTSDGQDLYIIGLSLLQEKTAIVEGPDGSVDYCTHQDQAGNSYLVSVEEAIAPTCDSIGYYAFRCSRCKATVIDNDKPMTEELGHMTEGQTVLTVYPTCTDPGYTYQYCSREGCGQEIVISTTPTLAHEYNEILNNAAGRMDYCCKHCGDKYSLFLNSTLMSGQEKYELLPAGSRSYLIYEGHNDTVKVGSFADNVGQGTPGTGNLSLNPKHATFVATRVGIVYGAELTKGDTAGKSGDVHNPYFDFPLGDYKDSFVYEFDIKPGKKGADGMYAALESTITDRTTGSGTLWRSLFNVDKNANLTFTNSTTAIKLDPDNFTNFAVAVDRSTGIITVYVNGVFALRCNTTIQVTDALRELRIQYKNVSDGSNTGSSYLFNNFLMYPGTAPLCLVNTDIVNESKGELGLYENDTPATDATPVTELTSVTEDKTLFLKSYEKSSEFSFSFKLSAAAALGNGTLLKVNKVDGFNTPASADVLTVKDGYLYYMGVPVAKLEAGKDVEIKFYCEDYLSRATVTVDGVDILVKRPYDTGDNFSATDAYVRSYTFCAIADSEYSIKDISFVTTAEAK